MVLRGARHARASDWVIGAALGVALLAVLLVLRGEDWFAYLHDFVVRRGLWEATTALVMPAFVGLAGTAVAVAAWRTSEKAAETSERAVDAEDRRVRRAERAGAFRIIDAWVSEAFLSMTNDVEGAFEQMDKQAVEVHREVWLAADSEPIRELITALWNWLDHFDNLWIDFNRRGTTSMGWQPSDELLAERDEAVARTKALQKQLRGVLMAWQQSPRGSVRFIDDFMKTLENEIAEHGVEV